MGKLNNALHDKLDNTIKSMGYELVGVEMLPQGRQLLLRIYVDRANGVTVDDCSLISRQLSAMLDVEDPIQSRYILEVSSPGVDRPLFVLEHYQKYVGQQIKVKLHVPIQQRRQFRGVLQRVEGDQIHLRVKDVDNEIVVPFSSIDKANLIGETDFKKSKP